MMDRYANQTNSLPSHSNTTGTATSASIAGTVSDGKTQSANLNSIEDRLFEHFTYGGEDITLFINNNRPSASCSGPCPLSPTEEPPMKQRAAQLMAYDKDFQLSPPPPPKRRASLTTSFNSMSFYNNNTKQQQNVKLTRTPSFSSIIQHI
jgi:hypothetical protein